MQKLLIIAILLVVGCDNLLKSFKHGCTSTNACNYNDLAGKDDGSCFYPCESTNSTDLGSDCFLECCDAGDGDGNYSIMDCNGICGGSSRLNVYHFDNDGDGLGNNISEEFCSGDIPDGWVANNDDKDDNCYSNIHDCLGICDGDCDVCDCFGMCGGIAVRDECFICNGAGMQESDTSMIF